MRTWSASARRIARLCACALVWLGPAGLRADGIEASCALRFAARSSLHDFEGEAPCASVAISPDPQGAGLAAVVEIEIAQMTTGIAARDARMREMFDAERFPRIRASATDLDVAALRRAAAEAGPAEALAFELQIGAQQRRIVPRLSGWREAAGGSLHFLASFEVSLQSFELRAPTVMGLVRVQDRVRAEVEVELRGLPSALAPPADPARAPRDEN